MPPWVRSFITDFIETGLAALLALQFVIPATLEEGRAIALLVVAALAGAFVAAVRRAVPAFIAWLNGQMGV